jgi:large subunit ribosomal protein L31
MRPGIHPRSQPVVFRDRAADITFLTRSTADSAHSIEWQDGNTYPLVEVEISSASHPFYTGTSRIADTAGRVERYERRYGRATPAQH